MIKIIKLRLRNLDEIILMMKQHLPHFLGIYTADFQFACPVVDKHLKSVRQI